ncbi:hypothetical protein V1517DRAFT_311416 [Lipomyces orientalis]|uniref:Uncharacterized protein n=1 Tax=Lipomyces orientalis TaxID=1233043 RepID=A0ACC3TZ71_9ASCO
MRQRSRLLGTSRYRFFTRPRPPSPDTITTHELDSITTLSSPMRLSDTELFQDSARQSPVSDVGALTSFSTNCHAPYFPPLELAEPLDAETMLATISMHIENDESFWRASNELAQTIRQTMRASCQGTIVTSVYASDDYCGASASADVSMGKIIDTSSLDLANASVSTVIVHPVNTAANSTKQPETAQVHSVENHYPSSPTLSSPTGSLFSTTPEELSSPDTDQHDSERLDAVSSSSPAPSPPRVPRRIHCFHHNQFEPYCAACLMELKQSVILERKRLQIMDALLQSVEDENRATTSAKARYLGLEAARIVADMVKGKKLHGEE